MAPAGKTYDSETTPGSAAMPCCRGVRDYWQLPMRPQPVGCLLELKGRIRYNAARRSMHGVACRVSENNRINVASDMLLSMQRKGPSTVGHDCVNTVARRSRMALNWVTTE